MGISIEVQCKKKKLTRYTFIFHLAAPNEVNDIIHKMWDTVLDHNIGYQQNLASSTYLVYKIEGMHKPGILKNDTTHAEKQLISIIQGNFTAPLKIIIYIYINN